MGPDPAGRNRSPLWAATVDHRAQHVLRPLNVVAEQVAQLGKPDRLALIAAVLIAVGLIGRSGPALAAAGASVVIQLMVVEAILKPLVESRQALGATPPTLGATVTLLVCARIDRMGSTDQPPEAGGTGSDNRSTAETAVTPEPSMIQAPTTPS